MVNKAFSDHDSPRVPDVRGGKCDGHEGPYGYGYQHGTSRHVEPHRNPRPGSVSTRASQYRLSWDEANPGSRGLQNGQHGRGPPEVEQSAAIGGNVLVVAGARAEEVAQFIVSPAEPGG